MSDGSSLTKSESPPHPARVAVGYALMLLGAVALFLVIRWLGEKSSLDALPTPGARPAWPSNTGTLAKVFGALLAVILTGRLLGTVFRSFDQPCVVGEVVAGILLGPSFLGRLSPELMAWVLPFDAAPLLAVIAQLGVILYMFVVGLELNAELLRSRAHATVAISHASIVVPFLCGATLALWLHKRLAPEGVSFTTFALFLGAAMAITAFPVLARILTDQGLEKTPLGVVALSCAAADDVTAWCLLAFVVGVANSALTAALTTTGLAIGYIVLMFGVVQPIAKRCLALREETVPTNGGNEWVFVALLASALATEAIGIHAVFGAFLLGAVIPHHSAVAQSFRHKLEGVVTVLLLPAFFAYTGMRTEIGLVKGVEEWLMCAVIVLIATVGKFGGTVAAARLTGLDWRTSSALGVLMNTRGLMELIVLNIGLDLGVISPTLFAMMVIMALATTIATTPILRRLAAP